MKPVNTTPRDANQGEGDKAAARHYNQELQAFVEGGKVQPAARDAERFVAQQPLEAQRAEQKAKRGPMAARVSLDELLAKGRTLIDRVRPVIDRAVTTLRARFARK